MKVVLHVINERSLTLAVRAAEAILGRPARRTILVNFEDGQSFFVQREDKTITVCEAVAPIPTVAL